MARAWLFQSQKKNNQTSSLLPDSPFDSRTTLVVRFTGPHRRGNRTNHHNSWGKSLGDGKSPYIKETQTLSLVHSLTSQVRSVWSGSEDNRTMIWMDSADGSVRKAVEGTLRFCVLCHCTAFIKVNNTYRVVENISIGISRWFPRDDQKGSIWRVQLQVCDKAWSYNSAWDTREWLYHKCK